MEKLENEELQYFLQPSSLEAVTNRTFSQQTIPFPCRCRRLRQCRFRCQCRCLPDTAWDSSTCKRNQRVPSTMHVTHGKHFHPMIEAGSSGLRSQRSSTVQQPQQYLLRMVSALHWLRCPQRLCIVRALESEVIAQ